MHSSVWNFFYNLTSYFQLFTITTWLISAPNINQSIFGWNYMDPCHRSVRLRWHVDADRPAYAAGTRFTNHTATYSCIFRANQWQGVYFVVLVYMLFTLLSTQQVSTVCPEGPERARSKNLVWLVFTVESK